MEMDRGEDVEDRKEKELVNTEHLGASEVDSSSSGENSAQGRCSTFWSDDKGNLKFVNLVVRNPCCIFCSILLACIALSFLLIVIVFQNGNPFSDPGSEGDLKDERTIQYDSLRLAHEEIEDALADLATAVPQQSETADFTYWVFESKTPQGVFASESSIAAMKEAFDLFLLHEQYDQYCKLIYPSTATNSSNAGDSEPYCDPPLTPLTMYYAAEWNETAVAAVLEQLKTPGNIELFNQLALCYTRGLFCDLVSDDVDPADIEFALQLDASLQDITQHWDMTGELVPNISQATDLAAYLKLIDTYKGLVDFGFDKGFSIENNVSIYSRGLLLWGGPLETSEALTKEEREDLEEDEDEERKE
eukprot:scaffold7012_cov157-Amphora_coffeaeformis.AAC.15